MLQRKESRTVRIGRENHFSLLVPSTQVVKMSTEERRELIPLPLGSGTPWHVHATKWDYFIVVSYYLIGPSSIKLPPLLL